MFPRLDDVLKMGIDEDVPDWMSIYGVLSPMFPL